MQANIRVGCSTGVSVSKRGHLVTGRASVGDLTWALQSVKLARLYGDLLAKPATVFAPDDEALRKYSAAHPGAEALLPTEELRNIIANHIVPGKGIRAAELTNDNVSLTSLTGLDLNISYTEGKAVVTTSAGVSATVVKSDVLFGLGSVVHVIDNVLT
ncbi:FAS1 domain-containing protein [Haematococcus lacustris]